MKHFIGYLLILFVGGLGIYAASVFAADHEFFHTFPFGDSPKKVSVLDIPLPQKANCFNLLHENRSKKRCKQFSFEDAAIRAVDENSAVEKPFSLPNCDAHFNPVYDEKGIFYPSACWAEQFGVKKYTYGVSRQMKQFMSDLWETAKYLHPEKTYIRDQMIGFRFQVPDPVVTFTYKGSGLDPTVYKNGAYLRSSVWLKDNALVGLDFNINTNVAHDKGISFFSSTYPHQQNVHGETQNILMVFMPFNDLYPNKILLQNLRKYNALLNKNLKIAQKVNRPIQYRFTPVFLDPTAEIKKQAEKESLNTLSSLDLFDATREEIFKLATKKIGHRNFDMMVLTPIAQGPLSTGHYGRMHVGGGLEGPQNEIGYIYAPIGPEGIYNNDTSLETIRSVFELRDWFFILDHEILHALGYHYDHIPASDESAAKVDPVTGKYLSFSWRTSDRLFEEHCDAVAEASSESSKPLIWKLPKALQIRVGSEPSWAKRLESESGPCIMPRRGNSGEMLKDLDRDGIYDDFRYTGMAHRYLKEFLGWLDTDGDLIAELEDQNPYGGLKIRKNPPFREALAPSMGFEMLGEEKKAGCRFAKIKLDNQEIGLAPLECSEFKDYLVNIYKGVKYDWIKMQKNYGTVFLPTLKSVYVK